MRDFEPKTTNEVEISFRLTLDSDKSIQFQLGGICEAIENLRDTCDDSAVVTVNHDHHDKLK
jgi:hypothetical protein